MSRPEIYEFPAEVPNIGQTVQIKMKEKTSTNDVIFESIVQARISEERLGRIDVYVGISPFCMRIVLENGVWSAYMDSGGAKLDEKVGEDVVVIPID